MTRSWVRRSLLAAVVVAVALGAAMPLLAADDDTVLVGITAERGPAAHGKKLVIKYNSVPYVGPPGQLPDDPGDPPKNVGASVPAARADLGSASGIGQGGVGMIASASPQTRVENSLKDLARGLR